jgi:hypothetical protein
VAARVLHHLVTSTGTKIAHSATDLADYTGLPEDRVRAVLDRLSAPDARILRTVAAPAGQEGEPRYEIFHDVLAPAVLGWRAQWEARRRAEAAAARQLGERTRRWRRRLALAALLIGLVTVVALSMALLAVTSQRDKLVAQRDKLVAQRSAYVAQADTICTKGWATGRVEAGLKPAAGQDSDLARWLMEKVNIGRDTSERWSRLRPRPAGTDAQTRTILELYDHGLNAYELAALGLATGQTDLADRALREGEQLGVAYQQLATRNGYRECQKALPL